MDKLWVACKCERCNASEVYFFIHQKVFILTTHTPMTSENAESNIKLDTMQPNIIGKTFTILFIFQFLNKTNPNL